MTPEPNPMIGVAFSASTPDLLRENPGAVDYVEVPFELLCHDPSVSRVKEQSRVILHCASLSLAGTVRPPRQMVAALRQWCQETQTPWVGEHLAFITAERSQAGGRAVEYAAGEPYNIGYTVAPPMNAASVRTVARAIKRAEAALGLRLLIENSPLYFATPGSTMSQTQFISEICARTEAGLLLDLSHFFITSRTLDFDPRRELHALPLERVVELHLSGLGLQSGIYWDNHARRAPTEVYELLALALARAPVKAITLEYNWSSQFPRQILLAEIARVRQVVADTRQRRAAL